MTQHIVAVSNYLQNPIEALLHWVKSIFSSIEYARNVNSTVKELSRLTDRELNDIGLARGDIYSVARGDATLKRTAVNENSNLKGWV